MLFTVLLVLAQPHPTPEVCSERVRELLFSRVEDDTETASALRTALESEQPSSAALMAFITAFTRKHCVKPPALITEWLEWEASADGAPFRREAELLLWADAGARELTRALTARSRELKALSGEALCVRAMKAVAKPLVAVTFSKREGEADVVRRFTRACIKQRLGETHRAALTCYAKIQPAPLFPMLEAMDECDLDSEPALDEWVTATADQVH